MPITPAHRRGNDAYNAKCGRIEIRPIQDVVDDIKAAAEAAGQSLQKYILHAVRARMQADNYHPVSANWPEKDNIIDLKYCMIAKFSDNTIKRFPGISKDFCIAAIYEYSKTHGDICWYDRVTDEQYCAGILWSAVPDPPTLPIIDLTEGI